MKTDWDSDPELKALRDEFAASFSKRKAALEKQRRTVDGSEAVSFPPESEVPQEIRLIAHNLAGSAATYGFDAVGKVATLVDDYLSRERIGIPGSRLLSLASLLDQLLSGKVPDEAALKELTSCVESLASAAKP